jgi:hypothetical protein
MTIIWVSASALVVVVALGFGLLIFRVSRLEGRLRRWLQQFSDRIVTIAASDTVRSLLASPRYSDPRCLTVCGRKIYSQGDEDGILEEIFRRIGTSSRRFLEVGVGNGLENNTLALLLKGWTGTWIDESPQNGNKIRKRFGAMLKDGRLRFLEHRVTLEDLSGILEAVGSLEDLDVLSIDIDGNDYHILTRMPITARVLVLEYNARFAPPIEWVMAYNKDHTWDGSDYFGASLSSYTRLLAADRLVGCSLTGVNAFFVRSDLLGENLFMGPFTAETHYEPARYWLIPGLHGGHRPNIRLG